jgi:hypothetical protein
MPHSYRARTAIARPPSTATEPAAKLAAAPVAMVLGPVVVLVVAPEPLPLPEVVVVRVTLVGPEVAVVERLPLGVMLAKVDADLLEEVALVVAVTDTLPEELVDEPLAELVTDALPELLTELVEPPVMWKGNEYWKMVLSESRLICRPYVEAEPRDELTDHAN